MATDDDVDPFREMGISRLKEYISIRSIEGKILKLLGNAACCDINGKVEYYNIKSMKNFLELKLCGLMMEIEEGSSLGEKSLLIKNKTDASSITEKLQSANFTLKEEKEQITLFVNRAINLAFDVPIQELYSIKADKLKSVTPLSYFQEEEALSSMSLDNIENRAKRLLFLSINENQKRRLVY
ncbi:hypothetical protein ACTFIW_008812 [Dictyostelium discoideum]